jgi:ketosteroid isomerase-like protein
MSPENAAQALVRGRGGGPGRSSGGAHGPRLGGARGVCRGVVVLLLGLVVLVTGACSFTSSDRRAIEGVLAEQSAAWNHGDLDGFLRAYEPSQQLIFTSVGAIRRGFAEARARYLERYGARKETMGHLEFEILDIRGLDRRGAVVLGRWRLTETEESGAGVFTLVFRREGRGWYIVHDHTSVDSDSGPPPADSADASASASP